MDKLLILLIALILCAPLSAKQRYYGDAVVSEVTSIYDGDTFRANINTWHPLIGERVGIRVNGVDTPEMRGKCKREKTLARRAKQHTVALLRSGKLIELRNMQRGKYFRIVADVYIDGVNLSDSLINSGHGVPYHGKKKSKNWCD